VGRPEIQKACRRFARQEDNKRVFITTGSVLDETRRYMEMIDSKIVLIDGKQRAD
jgi:restriction system protein